MRRKMIYEVETINGKIRKVASTDPDEVRSIAYWQYGIKDLVIRVALTNYRCIKDEKDILDLMPIGIPMRIIDLQTKYFPLDSVQKITPYARRLVKNGTIKLSYKDGEIIEVNGKEIQTTITLYTRVK